VTVQLYRLFPVLSQHIIGEIRDVVRKYDNDFVNEVKAYREELKRQGDSLAIQKIKMQHFLEKKNVETT